MCIIIGEVHQFIANCLIPLDPWYVIQVDVLKLNIILEHSGNDILRYVLRMRVCLVTPGRNLPQTWPLLNSRISMDLIRWLRNLSREVRFCGAEFKPPRWIRTGSEPY